METHFDAPLRHIAMLSTVFFRRQTMKSSIVTSLAIRHLIKVLVGLSNPEDRSSPMYLSSR